MPTRQTLSTTDWLFDDSDSSERDSNKNYHCVITSAELGTITAFLPQDFTLDIAAQYEESLAQAANSKSSELSGLARMGGVQLVTQALTAQVWQGSGEMTFSLPLIFQVEDDEQKDLLIPLSKLYQLTLPGELPNGLLKAPGPTLNYKLLTQSVGAFVSGSINIAKDAISAGADNLTEGARDLDKYLGTNVLQPANGGSADKQGGNQKQANPQSAGQPPDMKSCIDNNISLDIGNYMHFDSVVIMGVSQTHHVQPLETGTMSRVDVQVTFKTFFIPTKRDIPSMFKTLSR